MDLDTEPQGVLAGPRVAEGLLVLGPELAAVLNEAGVPMSLQAKLALAGFAALELFAQFDETASEVRTGLATSFDFAASQGLDERNAVCRILRACSKSRTTSKTRDDRAAAERARSDPVTVEKSELLWIKPAFEGAWAPEGLDDKRCSAQSWFEVKSEQLADGEL